jgi:hypothetical protein
MRSTICVLFSESSFPGNLNFEIFLNNFSEEESQILLGFSDQGRGCLMKE